MRCPYSVPAPPFRKHVIISESSGNCKNYCSPSPAALKWGFTAPGKTGIMLRGGGGSSAAYPGVAQLVARVLWEHQAAGSNPVTRTIGRLHGQAPDLISAPWTNGPACSGPCTACKIFLRIGKEHLRLERILGGAYA